MSEGKGEREWGGEWAGREREAGRSEEEGMRIRLGREGGMG